MSHECPTYIPPGATEGASQIRNGGLTGPVDCMPWAASRAIADETCGRRVPTGRTIRLLSSEPVPDPRSPGLNLEQIRDVAWDNYGIWLVIRKNVSWSVVESLREEGRGYVLAASYAPVADTKFDAGRGFRGNHAFYERTATYDPLADGRASGVWRYDGSLYYRETMKKAAGALDMGGGHRVGYGRAWIAVTKDLVPDFEVHVPAGEFWVYELGASGYIYDRHLEKTGGFGASCTPPHIHHVHSTARGKFPVDAYTLTLVTSGSKSGKWISGSKYVTEND